jgi:hypothetical protein
MPIAPLAPSAACYSRRRTTPPLKAGAVTAPAATTAIFAIFTIERACSAALAGIDLDVLRIGTSDGRREDR